MTIKKDEIIRVLGENGAITIKGEDNTVFANITNETEANQEGYIQIAMPVNTYKLQIETTNAQNVGKIDFQLQKSIVEKQYTRAEIKEFTAIEDKITAKGEEIKKQITLKETSTAAKLQLSNNTLNEGENKNFQIKVTLLTENESQDLYKNPTIKILLPRETTEVTASYKMLYANGLEIQSSALKEENGIKFIEMKLSGEQLTYPGQVIGGTEILVNANITMNRLMTSGKDNITLSFTNDNATVLQNEGTVQKEINTKQSQKIIVTNDMEELGVKTIGKEEEKKIELEASEENKNATVKIGAINNEGETLENVKILGRFPTQGQTNTMDITLTSGINVKSNTQGVSIYYSDKEEATEDLNNENNGWSTDANIENKRSYLIVINTFEAAQKFEAEYGVIINQNVTDSKNASESFEVVYSKSNSTEVNRVESCRVGVSVLQNIEIELKIRDKQNNGTIQSGMLYSPYLSIVNNSSRKLENIKVEFVTNELFIIRKDLSGKIQADNTLLIDEIKPGETKIISLEVDCLDRNEKLDYATVYAKVYINNETYKSNMIKEYIERYSANVEFKSTVDGNTNEVKRGDKIKYTLIMENTGTEEMEELFINDHISKYLEILSIKLNNKETTYQTEKLSDEFVKLTINTKLKVNSTLKLEIETKVKNAEYESDIEIFNSIYIFNGSKYSADGLSDQYYVLKKSKGETINEETDEKENNDIEIVTNRTHKITGTVWLDENISGSKHLNFNNLKDVKVTLLDESGERIIRDNKNIEISVSTDEKGEYSLSNIEKGKYIVMFEYNTDEYTPTYYKKDNISEENNSDAIKKSIIKDDKASIVAVTDILEINEDINNIDLGLIKIKNFDIKLTKTINKVIVNDEKGSKEYNLRNATLGKIEIDSKKINSTNIVIEYTISLQNIGETSGYVKEVIDQIPNELDFIEEYNSDWYKEGEYLYNKSISSKLLKPGEVEEIKILLTKKMSENNTGLICNTAQIITTESSENISGLEFISHNKKDNDINQANLIIGIKTGSFINYLVISISIILIIGSIIYLIKKDR